MPGGGASMVAIEAGGARIVIDRGTGAVFKVYPDGRILPADTLRGTLGSAGTEIAWHQDWKWHPAVHAHSDYLLNHRTREWRSVKKRGGPVLVPDRDGGHAYILPYSVSRHLDEGRGILAYNVTAGGTAGVLGLLRDAGALWYYQIYTDLREESRCLLVSEKPWNPRRTKSREAEDPRFMWGRSGGVYWEPSTVGPDAERWPGEPRGLPAVQVDWRSGGGYDRARYSARPIALDGRS